MPYHIIIVDDDPYFRSEVRELLSEFDVIPIAKGEEALKILKKPHNIDLVILDQMMPGMKGTDLLKEIHKISPDIRTLLLTGQGTKEVAIEGLRGHATEFIEKPLNEKKIKKIRDLVLCAPKGEKDKNVGGIKGKIEQAKFFAQRNYNKPLTLDDVANEVCLSPKYLSRLFKEQTGMRFSDYKLQIRMDKAKQKLLDQGDNIEEIACQLGYQNPESFIKVFHKFFQCTPKQFRDKKYHKQFLKLTESSSRKKKSKGSLTIQFSPKMLSRSKDAIMELNKEGRIMRWSDGATRIYGWKKSDVINKKVDIIIPQDIRKKFFSFVKQMKNGRPVESFETSRKTKSGKLLDIWNIVIPQRNAKGELVSMLMIDQDVTKRLKKSHPLHLKNDDILERHNHLIEEKISINKEVERKNKELEKTKQQLEKEKHFSELGRLATNIAHELRHPIGTIQTAAFNIRKKTTGRHLDENLDAIEKMLYEQEQIINNLLEYSRLKEPVFQSIFIKELITDIVKTMKLRLDNNRVKITKSLKIVSGQTIQSDPIQIKEVLTNLFTNAYEALPEGKIGKIVIRSQLEKNSVVIEVKDNGEGIDPEDQKKIFEPFYSRKPKGTGLGLAISYEIIQMHHGSIDFKSQKSKGTTFTIKLPLQQTSSRIAP